MITEEKVLSLYKAWRRKSSFKNQVSFERAVFTYFIQELGKILKGLPQNKMPDILSKTK